MRNILRHLKEHDGKITYDDLVKMGVYKEGELKSAGRDYASLLETEYRLNKLRTSFAHLDQEERMKQEAQRTMLFAMTVAPFINSRFDGLKDVIYKDNGIDRTDSQIPKDGNNNYYSANNHSDGSFNGFNLFKDSEGVGSSLNKLPNTTLESVSTKLDTYLLEPTHPVGGSKAKWFKEALGFTKDNSTDLAKQIVFDPKKAVQTATNAHGTKFSQIIPVQGANSKVINVEFIFIKNNDGVTRLVTSIPTKR